MSLKFLIKELGPIKNSEFTFKPFTIFTGKSNLGKSYTAFLIYGFFKLLEEVEFKNFIGNMFNFAELSKTIAKGESDTIIFERKKFEKYLNENISNQIAYLIGNDSFKCNVNISTKFEDFEIKVNAPEMKRPLVGKDVPFLYVDGKHVKIADSFTEQNEESLVNIFHIKIYKLILKKIFGKEWLGTIILPPGRGAVYPSSFTMKKNIANTGMYNDFLERMDEVTAPSTIKINTNDLINSLLFEIFQGKITIEKDKFYYEFDKQKIPLQAAASSIKELAPLNLILQKSILNQTSILLEEPEAHLHPNLQRKIATLLAAFINYGGFLQVTTHSDYFLNQINNLIKLFLIKKNMKREFTPYLKQFKKYGIKAEIILNPDDVGAYYFQKRSNGSVEIIKQELEKEAVPFETFEKTVDMMMEETDIINEEFYSE